MQALEILYIGQEGRARQKEPLRDCGGLAADALGTRTTGTRRIRAGLDALLTPDNSVLTLIHLTRWRGMSDQGTVDFNGCD